MFKIEVVAGTPEEMASKLSALAEIYKEGARVVGKLEAVYRRDAADAPVPEPVKRGRKPKPVETITVDPPKQDAPPTIDDVRVAMKNYIDAAAVKSGREETRREEFKALLDHFGVPKLGELPEEKWPEMIALAKEKQAAL
jgi:hypothetical protein